MATRLQSIANIRLAWQAVGTPADFRDPLAQRAGGSFVMEAYVEADKVAEQDLGELVRAGDQLISGWVTRYRLLGEGETWLEAGTAWEWIETGDRPPTMGRGAMGKAAMGDLSILPDVADLAIGQFRVLSFGGRYSLGGVGLRERLKVGDPFAAALGTLAG